MSKLKLMERPEARPQDDDNPAHIVSMLCYNTEVCPHCGNGGKFIETIEASRKVKTYGCIVHVDQAFFKGRCTMCGQVWIETAYIPGTLRLSLTTLKFICNKITSVVWSAIKVGFNFFVNHILAKVIYGIVLWLVVKGVRAYEYSEGESNFKEMLAVFGIFLVLFQAGWYIAQIISFCNKVRRKFFE